MKVIFTAFTFLLSITIITAQPLYVDSLKEEFLKAPEDSMRLRLLSSLIYYYQNYKPDSALFYSRQMISLSQHSGNKFYEVVGFSEVGNALGHLGNYPKALEMELKSLKLAEQLKDRREERVGYVYLQIGLLDRANSRYESAIANFQKAIGLQKKRGASEVTLHGMYSQIASAYIEMNNLDSAFYYAQKGYALFSRQNEKRRGPLVFNVLGDVQEKSGNYKLAKSYYHSAIAKAQEIQFDYGQAKSYLNLAMLFKNQGEKDSCVFYAQKSLQLSLNHSFASYIIEGYNYLVQMYQLQNKPDSTLKYLKLMVGQKDSVYSQTKMQQYQVLLFDEEQRQQQFKAAELNYRNKIISYGMLSIIFGALLIAAILYRNNRQKQKANVGLQQQQARTEQALKELKSTQGQLIQSEKMASLGELTAGIAHEIQNPLNFVNNFSEINTELIDELDHEAEKGNIDEVRAIANDIKENEQKITEHGKRADAIVKGMLQHSRASTGKKEPTDINVLADEYLRLSYHGLRAKDKDFNADFKTDFDESIGKIEVVPQDIGRVLLNLFNNAFYAVNEKKKQLNGSFEPAVSVSTKRLGDIVQIEVRDNGIGIPQKVVDKIFQPFFTTKPTGQGTGLGLLLSYDIIKAHGGELKVETKEGEGAGFVIHLPSGL